MACESGIDIWCDLLNLLQHQHHKTHGFQAPPWLSKRRRFLFLFYINSLPKDSNEIFVEDSLDNSEESIVEIVEDSLDMTIKDEIKGTQHF